MSDFANQVEQIMKAHPMLPDGGYGHQRSYKVDIAELRRWLLNDESLSEIERLCAWIKSNLSPSKSINYRHSSYNLKHLAERETGYVSNGQFIVAALLLGYRMGSVFYSPSFNISESSIKRTHQRLYPIKRP